MEQKSQNQTKLKVVFGPQSISLNIIEGKIRRR